MEPNKINPISVLSRMHVDDAEPGYYKLALYHLTEDNIEDMYFKLRRDNYDISFEGYGKYFKILLPFRGEEFGLPGYTQDAVYPGDYILVDINRHIHPVPIWKNRFGWCLEMILSMFKNHIIELKEDDQSITFEMINDLDKLNEIFSLLEDKNSDYIMTYNRIAVPPSEHKRIYFIEIGDCIINTPDGIFIVAKPVMPLLNKPNTTDPYFLSKIIKI